MKKSCSSSRHSGVLTPSIQPGVAIRLHFSGGFGENVYGLGSYNELYWMEGENGGTYWD